MSISLSICLFVRLSVYSFICFVSIQSSVCLFVRLSVLSFVIFVYSFVCLYIRPFVCLIIRFFVLSFVFLSAFSQSVCLFVRLSVLSFVCLSEFSQSVHVHRSARRTLRSVSFLSKLFIFHFCLLEKKTKNNCSCNSTFKNVPFCFICNHHIAISLRANLL